ALRLTSDPTVETNPSWSPDGASIAFLRVRPPETLDVVLISPLGGSERRIGALRHPHIVDAHTRPGAADTIKRRWISWMPTRDWLVVQDTPTNELSALFLLSVLTGEKRRLTTPARPLADRSPAVSPDGRAIAFVRGAGITSQVFVLKLDAQMAPNGEP